MTMATPTSWWATTWARISSSKTTAPVEFKEVGLALGLAYDALGNVHGTMGVECGDWNNDGWLDFYMTSYQRQLATLYQNQAGRFLRRCHPARPAPAPTPIRRSPGGPGWSISTTTVTGICSSPAAI